MASGDQVVLVENVMPPATVFAVFGVRTGGSTPNEQVPYYGFDAAADWYLDYYCLLYGYGGNGLTFWLDWMAATATTGGVLWGLAIRRLQDDTTDVDASGGLVSGDYNEVRDVAATLSGELSRATITFTNGADMNNLVNNERFILRVRRRGSDNTASTGDDMAGQAQLTGLIGTET